MWCIKPVVKFIAVASLGFPTQFAFAQSNSYPIAKVSFNDFKGLVEVVEPHRAERLIDLDTFLSMSKEPGVVVLDSRSKYRFDRIHIKGARHLTFSDFTQGSLKEVIPSVETKILIYCNNNFEGNPLDFPSKMVGPPRSIPLASVLSSSAEGRQPALAQANPIPLTSSDRAVNNQMVVTRKPLMLALNVPTFINLYGYGYRNVYELHELVDVRDPRVTFEGSIVLSESDSRERPERRTSRHRSPRQTISSEN